MAIKNFSQQLLKWFKQHGRKDLPWQKDKTPYRVWLSEVMLQQTQVSTVIPYFQKFIQQFPNIKKLANADINQVLALWSGLGYYSRARNLHQTAKIICDVYQAKFPADLTALQTLPGIGRSTAAAILSIAFEQANPILDGNVKRVLTRLFGIVGWPGDKEIEKKLWQLAEKLMPEKNAADYTQAIMDFGATLCIRGKPRCDLCPFQKKCEAYLQNRVQDFPYANPKKKKIPTRQTRMLIFFDSTTRKILLEKRAPVGIWGGLWSFPEMSCESRIEEGGAKQNIVIQEVKTLTSFRHTFTHFHLEIEPLLIQGKMLVNSVKENTGQTWYKIEDALVLGLPAPVKKILKNLDL